MKKITNKQKLDWIFDHNPEYIHNAVADNVAVIWVIDYGTQGCASGKDFHECVANAIRGDFIKIDY